MREINTSEPPAPCDAAPDLWFSELRRDKRQARTICATCPLQIKCREEAIGRQVATGIGDDGIWGGLDLDQRTELIRRRSLEMASVSSAA